MTKMLLLYYKLLMLAAPSVALGGKLMRIELANGIDLTDEMKAHMNPTIFSFEETNTQQFPTPTFVQDEAVAGSSTAEHFVLFEYDTSPTTSIESQNPLRRNSLLIFHLTGNDRRYLDGMISLQLEKQSNTGCENYGIFYSRPEAEEVWTRYESRSNGLEDEHDLHLNAIDFATPPLTAFALYVPPSCDIELTGMTRYYSMSRTKRQQLQRPLTVVSVGRNRPLRIEKVARYASILSVQQTAEVFPSMDQLEPTTISSVFSRPTGRTYEYRFNPSVDGGKTRYVMPSNTYLRFTAFEKLHYLRFEFVNNDKCDIGRLKFYRQVGSGSTRLKPAVETRDLFVTSENNSGELVLVQVRGNRARDDLLLFIPPTCHNLSLSTIVRTKSDTTGTAERQGLFKFFQAVSSHFRRPTV